MEAEYDRSLQLEQRVEQLEKQLRGKREAQNGLNKDLEAIRQEASASSERVKALESKNKGLEATIEDLRTTLEDQQKATQSIDSHLDKAYADLNAKEAARKAISKAKDTAEEKLKETELKFAQLEAQYNAAQDTITELQSQEDFEQLQRDYAAVEGELEDMRDAFSERDHEVTVKDARIARLETDLQKALQAKLTAEAAASAAIAPTDVPLALPSTDSSLQAELEEVDESDFDYTSINEPELLFAPVATIADIPPVAHSTPKLSLTTSAAASNAPIPPAQPKLSFESITAITSVPIELKRTSASTQTERPQPQPQLSIGPTIAVVSSAPIEPQRTTTFTQTSRIVPPETAEAGIQASIAAIVTQTSPVAPSSHDTGIQTDNFSATDDVAHTPDGVEIVTPDPRASRKFFGSDMMSLLLLLFIIVPVYLWLQHLAHLSANGHGYYAQHHLNSGAFGNGRYLLGVWPIGFDIGHSALSEQVARHTAGAISSFEKWAGLSPTPFY
ncbi:hypothetical protein DM02DRAFT_615274 [Periconia macrospinosa]|uniref:Uncharacterized protein n=1 Tax=Periconia macrospinosa TaxID=97972 RepID=A0A2V1DML2_9PLEO|nr:hypothetical protein DM02DRAFT_615274 [Periconia macrospinosa]